MKLTELNLKEDYKSYVSPKVQKYFKDKGYKYLARGQDQVVFLAPDNTILKVFGTRKSSTGTNELTRGQEVFIKFAEYCRRNQNNLFLPKFSEWKKFKYDGNLYLVIKMERLFRLTDKFPNWADLLEDLTEEAEIYKDKKGKEEWISRNEFDPDFIQMLSYLGKDGFNKLWDTIYSLMSLARKLGLPNLDLHGENFMFGSDGNIVISDPFFTGWDSHESSDSWGRWSF